MLLSILIRRRNSYIFGDLVVGSELVKLFVELGKGYADGDEVDLGVGLADEFDKIITVAVHGNEFAAGLAGL